MTTINASASPRHGSTDGTTPRRKRLSPTLHSTGSNSALVYPVPESIAWLEQLSLSVTIPSTPKAKLRDASFVLRVDHPKAKISWSHVRSFNDYRAFQKRLQQALRHGHFCHAECPWLFTFVKSYFPKNYVLGALVAPKHVLHTRREALERYIKTLQTFLVNRSNHCCSVLTSMVADEMLAFVNGDVGKTHQCRLRPTPSSDCAALTTMDSLPILPRRSWDANTIESDQDDSFRGGQDDPERSEALLSSTGSDDEDICRICRTHLAEKASPTNGSLATPTSTSSTTSSCTEPIRVSPDHAQVSETPMLTTPAPLPPPAPPIVTRRASSKMRGLSRPHFYTTQLACGHRFHDECIVPRLNETMNCPVCGREELTK